MARITHVSALTLVAACWLSAVGCSSSNDPAGGGSAGRTSSAAGTVGNPLPPSGGSGGENSGAAGSTAIAGTSNATGGVGGTSPVAGGAGTGTGTAGTGSADFMPLCAMVAVTAAGAAPTKGGACTATDTQQCFKTCGPSSTGYKSETCTNGAYVEQSGCTFPPDLDATCYKIPEMIDASCPAMPPQASQPCTVAACTLCNVGGNYLDSTGASKVGYCVCPAPGTSGTSKWSCASATAWPCPAGKGC
jgi:hypothetical protein